MMPIGIPLAMAIMGMELHAICLVFAALAVLALVLFIANVIAKKSQESQSQSANKQPDTGSPQSPLAYKQSHHTPIPTADKVKSDDDDPDDDDLDDEWDTDDYDDGDDGFDDTEPDYWYGDSGSGSQRRSPYHLWIDDDEFHELKVTYRHLMRLLTKMSHDHKLRDTVLGQARDRDTIVGQYGQKDFLVTLKLLLAKDIIYTYEQFGLDADMDFDTPEGQLLLAQIGRAHV